MRRRSSYASLLLPLLLSAPAALAQTTGSIGIGTTTPDPAAALDISATGKGLLIPRLDSAQRAAIPSPPTGLMVFQTDGRQGFWYYGGGQWLYLPDKTRTGDNLGSHRATRNLDLGPHQLVGHGGTSGLAIDSTGRVGVGTTAPVTPLHVLGPTYDVATFATNLGAGPHLLLERDSSRAVIDYIGLGTSNGTREGALELRGNTSVQISGDVDVAQPDLTVLANGNVGIGTVDPRHKLHVNGQLYTESIRFPDNSLQTTAAAADNLGNHSATRVLSLNDNDLHLRTAADGNHGLGYYATGGQDWLGQNVDGPVLYGFGGGVLGTNRNGSRSSVLTWNYQGQVGIGTSSPQYALDVNGTARAQALRVQTSANDVATLESGGVGPHLNLLKTGATGQATIDYIGAGVTNSYRDGALELRGSSAVQISGNNDATPELTVRADGNVGIGTTAPGQKLEVAGQIFSNTGGFRFPDNTVQLTAAAADNLGNHTATRNLNLSTFQLVGNGSTQGLSITSTGNVGVGTTSAQTPLHVASTGYDAATLESSAAGPHLNLVRTGSPGQAVIDYIGTGTGNGTREGALELRGNTAVQISGNNDATPELTVRADGKVGVGTADPQATLDVNGSVRLGPQGTPMRNLQSGVATMGPSSGQTKSLTFTFPHAFTTAPIVLITASAEFNTDVWDTFAVSVRWVTPTQMRVNVSRIDEYSGWGQQLRLNWMAWEQ